MVINTEVHHSTTPRCHHFNLSHRSDRLRLSFEEKVISMQSSEVRLPAMSSVSGNMRLVFFDLDTSGLKNNKAEVLGIAAKSDELEFHAYITPSGPIPVDVTAINKLKIRDGNREYDNTMKLQTVSRREALVGLLEYLRQFEYRCVLIAHYWPFHRSFLMPMIVEENLQDEFARVIAGFTDTLKMFEGRFPERVGVSGALTLPTLVAELGLPIENVRQAHPDVGFLQTVAYHHFTQKQDFVQNMSSFATEFNVIDSFVCLFVSTENIVNPN